MAAACAHEWLPVEGVAFDDPYTAVAPATGAAGATPAPSPNGGAAVVTARGEIDIATADALRARTIAALARHVHVAIDLAEVTFIDCGGLRALTGAHQLAQRTGRRLTLRFPSRPVARLLALTGLDRELTVEPGPGNGSGNTEAAQPR